ncbi:FAD-dependent oxidoreductase [Candidatus Dependentiae bacterium]|nr:FAD-dependent oxidoreductase [Candidatus Dependentiae bacterium]
MTQNIIIVGTSAAGLSCAAKLVSLRKSASLSMSRITMLSAEQDLPYNKCLLADYCAGSKTLQDIATRPAEFFTANDITLRLGTTVTQIDPASRSIWSHTGEQLRYDWLVLAVGLQPTSLPASLQADGLSGLYYFHRLQDVDGIISYIAQHNPLQAVVIGAGLSGLEAADALRQRGLAVTIIEAASQLLPRQIDAASAAFVQTAMEAAGIRVLLGRGVTAIGQQQGVVTSVTVATGETIACGLVVVAVGSQPPAELFAQASLTMSHGRLVVDRYMRTNQERILAAGDCCMTVHAHTQEPTPTTLWPDAIVQGMHAAQTIAGALVSYGGVLPAVSSTIAGVTMHAAGVVMTTDSGWQILQKCHNFSYHRILIDQNRIVRGFVLLNDRASLPTVRRSFVTSMPLEGEWL